MPRFNQPVSGLGPGHTRTKNYEGGDAYGLDMKLRLYSAVCAGSLQPKFYAPEVKGQIDEIRQLIRKVPDKFTAKLAVYAREQMYLRSIPLVLAVELAGVHQGDSLVGKMVSRIVQRADEITELLSYYQEANAVVVPKSKEIGKIKKLKKLSKQIRLGLAAAFNKFDEYQFSKYDREGDVKLRDALFLVHPKPKDDAQQALFDKIAKNELATAYTWESELSAKGNKKETWEDLIDSDRLPYMALLRNLRNILGAGVSLSHLEKTLGRISDPEEVHRSRQFPFRFFNAYREIDKAADFDKARVTDAIERAFIASGENIPVYKEDRIVVAFDDSGSMDHPLSDKSKTMYYEIGMILGALLNIKCDRAIVGAFSDEWRVMNPPKRGLLSWINDYEAVAGSTNGWLVLDDLIRRKLQADKVFVFTDMQLWNSWVSLPWGTMRLEKRSFSDFWHYYKQNIAPNAKLYLFDLAGHGTTPVSTLEKGVYFIAGWSDKVFMILDAIDKGSSAVQEIEKIEL